MYIILNGDIEVKPDIKKGDLDYTLRILNVIFFFLKFF